MPPPTMPWSDEGPCTRLLLQDSTNKPFFYRTDMWHNLQLGQGKAFCSSALVMMLPLFEGQNVEARFRTMTLKYMDFCRETWHYIGNF